MQLRRAMIFCQTSSETLIEFGFVFCDRDHVGITYSGGGLPLASHLIFMVWSKGRAIMGPDE